MRDEDKYYWLGAAEALDEMVARCGKERFGTRVLGLYPHLKATALLVRDFANTKPEAA